MPLIATSHPSLDFDSAFLCKTIYCCIILSHLLAVCSCAVGCTSLSQLLCFPSTLLILQVSLPPSLSPLSLLVPVLSLASVLVPTSFPVHMLPVIQSTPSNPCSVKTPKNPPQPFTNSLLLSSKIQAFGAWMDQNVPRVIDGRLIYLFHLQFWQQ